MTAPPRLAMCIPAYNAAKHLPVLLGSAAAQTTPFDEVWVYDDASTDGTSEVARSLGARVVRGEVNRGCSYGKNVLAQETTCEWVHFHDADDALFPNFVAAARRWMTDSGPDVVVFGYDERDPETGRVTAVRRFDDDDLRRDATSYVIRTKIVSICGLYRRVRFVEAGGYDLDPEVLYNEDVAMHCRLALRGLSFRADASVTVTNFIRTASMSSSNPVPCLRAHVAVMRKTARATGTRYASEISERLWLTAAGAASYLDWDLADAAAQLASSLAPAGRTSGGRAFRAVARLSPRLAIRSRELAIRLLKPRFRRGYPSLGALAVP